MHQIRVIAVVFAFTTLFFFPLAPSRVLADEILIAAAASLVDALKELAQNYEAKSMHRLVLNLGPSNFLARQIDEGAPSDIFLSADTAQMDFLDGKGRLEPGTRRNLISNQLVVIVRYDSPLAITSPKDLLKAEVKKIALADPGAVPVGVYTRSYLVGEALWEKVKPKIVPVLDVRATLAAVESGNVEAGFVYKTDAAISKIVRVVFPVPLDKGPKITYPIAIVKHSKKKDAARDFINYVLHPAGISIFKKHGFIVLD